MQLALVTRLGLASVAAALVAACAAPSAPTTSTGGATEGRFLAPLRPDQRVTITMENYNLATAGPMREGTLTLLEEFRQRFPNITVETKATSSPDIMSSVQAQVAAGSPPDVAQIVFSDLDFAVNNFNARPFEDLIAPDELTQHFQGFHPRGRALGVINGKTYGMPYVFSTPTLFYNADLFRQAGLDPDRPPRTWAEVRQAGLQIRERAGVAGVYIGCLGTFDWCFQGMVLSAGGRVMSPDRTRLTFAEPPALEAVTMWQDLVRSGAHPNVSGSEAIEAFQNGRLGMLLTTSALQGSFLRAAQGRWDLRAGGMPAFGANPVRPTNSGAALMILTDDPVKQRAAWELIKYLTSERGYTVLTSVMGYLPLRPSTVNDPQYLQDFVRRNPQILPNLAQLEQLEPWTPFPGPNYGQIRNIMMQAVEQTVLGTGDARTIMTDAQQRGTALMPRR